MSGEFGPIRSLAIQIARRKGFAHLTQEFIGFSLESHVKLSKTGKRINMSYAWRAFIRERYGDVGAGQEGRAKYKMKLAEDRGAKTDDFDPIDICEAKDAHLDLRELSQYLTELNWTQRAVICLTYVWGLSLGEVAFCFGFTQEKTLEIKTTAERLLREDNPPLF